MSTSAFDKTHCDNKVKLSTALGMRVIDAHENDPLFSGRAVRPLEHEKTKAAKADNNFFPTPWIATEAFMRAEGERLRNQYGTVHECACGKGDMAEVLADHGLNVVATDLIDRGFGEGGQNFLTMTKKRARAIVTNPPYEPYPAQFVRHAHKLGYEYVALLLKANWLHTKDRLSIWRELPPTYCYPLSFRLDFHGLGSGGLMDCTWYVWDWKLEKKAWPGFMTVDVLPKPDEDKTGVML